MGTTLGFQRRIPAILSAATDVALAKPGLRTAAYLAQRVWQTPTSPRTRRPERGASLGLAMKVGTDEAFRTLMVAMSQAPTTSELEQIRAEVEQAEALFDERGWIEDPASYHQDPPPLESPMSSKVSFWGSDYRHLRFDSEYEPHPDEPGRERWLGYDPVRTGHAWILRHKGRPRPWLVCIHGFRMGWPMADFTAFRAAWLHGVLGLNVAIPVLPLHGQRTIGRNSGDGFFSAQVLDTVHAETQAIWDLRRLISWIRRQGADDIGVYGVSLGGYTTALLSGFEGELTCTIAGMPPVCFADLLQNHAPAPLLRNAGTVGVDWERVRKVQSVVSPLAVPSKVPHGRRYLFAGAADRIVPPAHVESLWRHWDEPTIHWYDGSHLSFTWESQISEFVHRALHEAGLLWAPRKPRETSKAA